MRSIDAFLAAAVVCWWAAPLSAQSAFEQLEQQVKRDNAQDAARGAAPKTPGQEPGYLGVIAEDRQGGGKGLNVIEIIAGGPADKAGLKAGDFITSIDGQPTHSMQDFERILSAAKAGKKLAFQFSRAGQSQSVDITLGQRPPPGQRRFEQFGPIPEGATQPSAETRGGTLGVRIATVTPELQRTMALPGPSGALVVSVVEGSPAAQAGIVPGNVVLAVDGQRVDTPTDLSRLISQAGAGREVTLGYYNGTANVERKVVLGGGAPPSAPAGEVPASPPMSPQGGGFGPGQPLPGFGAAPGQYGAAPGQFGAAPGAVPGLFGGPGQGGGDGSSAGPDRLQMLEQRVLDVERRVRELEQEKAQSPPPSGTKATPLSDKQT